MHTFQRVPIISERRFRVPVPGGHRSFRLKNELVPNQDHPLPRYSFVALEVNQFIYSSPLFHGRHDPEMVVGISLPNAYILPSPPRRTGHPLGFRPSLLLTPYCSSSGLARFPSFLHRGRIHIPQQGVAVGKARCGACNLHSFRPGRRREISSVGTQAVQNRRAEEPFLSHGAIAASTLVLASIAVVRMLLLSIDPCPHSLGSRIPWVDWRHTSFPSGWLSFGSTPFGESTPQPRGWLGSFGKGTKGMADPCATRSA